MLNRDTSCVLHDHRNPENSELYRAFLCRFKHDNFIIEQLASVVLEWYACKFGRCGGRGGFGRCGGGVDLGDVGGWIWEMCLLQWGDTSFWGWTSLSYRGLGIFGKFLSDFFSPSTAINGSSSSLPVS